MPIYFSWLLIGVSTYNLLPSARYSFRRNWVHKRLVGSDVQRNCQPLWSLLNYSYRLEVVMGGGEPVILYCFSALFLIIPITVSVFSQREYRYSTWLMLPGNLCVYFKLLLLDVGQCYFTILLILLVMWTRASLFLWKSERLNRKQLLVF